MDKLDPKLIEKLEKCLALAAGAASEGEKAAAMEAAKRLMAKYQITETDLKLIRLEQLRIKSQVSSTKQHPWEAALFGTLSSAFGCSILAKPAPKGSGGWMHYNIVCASSILPVVEWLASTVSRMAVKARRDYKREHPGIDTKGLNDFCYGWVQGLKPAIVSLASGYAVFLDNGTVDAYYAKNGIVPKAARKSTINVDPTHAMRGQSAGSSVRLFQPMGGGAAEVLKLR